jgi:hypothetical protein
MAFGYQNPMRSMERKLSPDFAQREMRDPGIRSGLGSMHHTMPHLRNLSGMPHFQMGGATSDTLGQIAQLAQQGSSIAGRWENPDPRFRSFLDSMSHPQLMNRSLQTLQPLSFPYAEGGEAPEDEAPPDMQEVESPDQQMSPHDDQERQIVLEALAALEGESPDPEAALKAFIDVFGPRALADLQQLAEQKHSYEQSGDQDADAEGGPGDGQEDPMAQAAQGLAGAAGGGLLRGPGSGQSDEIEGVTPSGHPVLLSDGEYVIDAPTVAALGDGSTDAGARRLDALRKQIRMDAYGNDKQAKPMAKGGKPFTLKIP